MKKLVIYLFLFAGFFLVSDMLLFIITDKSLDDTAFKIPESKNVLIVGDSHLECALNDLIVDNAVNLAHSGEAYIFTCTKLKLFLEANPHIDTVLLSFNYRSLLTESELWLHDKNSEQNMDRYCRFFNGEERMLFSKTVYYYKSLLRFPYIYRGLPINKMLGNKNNYTNLKMGGYLYHDQDDLQHDIDLYGASYKEKQLTGDDYNPSSTQYIYLHKIVEYCTQHNVKLIFVNTPVYLGYQYGVEEYYAFYKEKYSYIQLWDYSDLALPDSCYADTHHLNYKGAEVFSKLVKKRMSGLKKTHRANA
ncbi:hypothetical protein [Viscerimonas tarda]